MFNSDSKEKTIISIILIVALILLLLTNFIGKNLQIFQNILIVIILICLIIYIIKLNKKKSFTEEDINNKYNDLVKHIGKPTYLETDNKGNINEATWMAPLNNYEENKFAGKSININGIPSGYIHNRSGLDFIKILGFKGRKHHPIPADMYIIAGKYMDVPPELIGLLKNASETINIEQLQVPHKLNKNFGKDFEHDKKGKSLVTGSCASVTISAITLQFVEHFIFTYDKDSKRHNDVESVKKIYDKYLLDYLCNEKEPRIPWFNPSDFGEPTTIPKIDKCSKIDMESYKRSVFALEFFNDSHKKAS